MTPLLGADAERVRRAVDEWYSANYPLGVRLSYKHRDNLASLIIRRLSLVESSSSERESA